MAVYVNRALWAWKGKYWCHMIADYVVELHEMADRLGLKRCWFQAKRPHYNLTEKERAQAIALGAVPLEREEFVEKWNGIKETL